MPKTNKIMERYSEKKLDIYGARYAHDLQP
jgi:hypothetical protein